MPVSKPKFVVMKSPATEYHLVCWKFGGHDEWFFADEGYGEYDYVAAIILGPNPALLVDRVGGAGEYAVERAGFYNAGDMAAVWEWILRNVGWDWEAEEEIITLHAYIERGEWTVKKEVK